ncbi:MAG: hypothetical protein IBX69_17965, partial [Anaerolineales bacterium]|nr:hypothetical protein [Anaerolineales bacterium]
MKSKKKQIYKPKTSLPSLVPPWVAGILSAIIPGLGQSLARQVRRGILVLLSFASIIGLLVWRFRLAAPRDTGFMNIVSKAFYLQPILIFITILVGLLYLANIYDAVKLAT